ncbi:MAG: sigma 54-interacting transcriptional regulator, partial [Armatimonadota bacterium]
RRDGPFVVVNCAAIAEGLLECELFGQEENAFDGAPFKLGRFEIADKGTLFLDEIGNMSLDFQMKILRVIEYQSFERVQGTERIDVDVHIIAASNTDLQQAIEAGRFRPDLYDRLAFQVIELPPLRERRDDIPLLCEHFVNRFAAEVPGIEPKAVSQEAIERLQRYDWPGNVRELKNVIENALLHSRGLQIRPEDIPLPQSRPQEDGDTFPEKVEAFEKSLLVDALSAAGWNQKKAAELLGLKYDQLRHLYRKHHLAEMKP